MTDLSYVTAIFFRALLNAHIFKTIECILAGEVSTPHLPPPPLPPRRHSSCVPEGVRVCVRVCPQQLFVFCTKKTSQNIKAFWVLYFKVLYFFLSTDFFYSFHSKLEIKFFFFLAIFSLDILCSVQLHNPPLLIWQQLENLVQRSTSTDC